MTGCVENISYAGHLSAADLTYSSPEILLTKKQQKTS